MLRENLNQNVFQFFPHLSLKRTRELTTTNPRNGQHHLFATRFCNLIDSYKTRKQPSFIEEKKQIQIKRPFFHHLLGINRHPSKVIAQKSAWNKQQMPFKWLCITFRVLMNSIVKNLVCIVGMIKVFIKDLAKIFGILLSEFKHSFNKVTLTKRNIKKPNYTSTQRHALGMWSLPLLNDELDLYPNKSRFVCPSVENLNLKMKG